MSVSTLRCYRDGRRRLECACGTITVWRGIVVDNHGWLQCRHCDRWLNANPPPPTLRTTQRRTGPGLRPCERCGSPGGVWCVCEFAETRRSYVRARPSDWHAQ